MAISIQVQNISTVMADDRVEAVLNAVTAQVAEDVAPVWGNQSVVFSLIPKDAKFSPGRWRFVVADSSDQAGAAGYHQTNSGEPIGYAFAKTTIDAGMNPSVTISHEILEMIGDALIDQANQWSDLPNALFLAQELCDPVEDDSLAYDKAGVKVSDFVTPAYFIPQSDGPWDFRNSLRSPNTLAVGGYQLTWDPTNGWQQKLPASGAKGRAAAQFAHIYSRRVRRLTASALRSAIALLRRP
jgi:hypothetical protein